MTPTVSAELHTTLWTLECAYWADVDHNGAERAAAFYTDDAVFDIGIAGQRFDGQEAIAEFYNARRGLGARTTLHIVHNFHALEVDESQVRVAMIMELHAAAGAPPRASAAPSMLTAQEVTYVRTGDGWKIRSRVNQVQFANLEDLPLDQLQSKGS